MASRHWAGAIGLALIMVIVGAITLTPATVDSGYSAEVQWVLRALHRVGVPDWFGYRQLEFTANIVMFVPLGFFAGLLVAPRWREAAFAMPALSLLIEGAQLLFLPGRVAAVSDVIANSVGGWFGLLLAVAIAKGSVTEDRSDPATLPAPQAKPTQRLR